MSRIRFLNTFVDNMTMDEAVAAVESLVERKGRSYVVTPNLDHIVKLEKDEQFRQAYDQASLILTDGKPMIWISKLKGEPIIEKISGSDLFPRVCQCAARKGYRLFILGAAEGVAQKAAQRLQSRFEGLHIVGTLSPAIGFEKCPDQIAEIIDAIREAKPDILAVALGTPKGEKFICQYREELGVPLSMQIGATIDFEAGNVRRAPRWMSAWGFEWLYRIWQDPRRLAGRYLRDAVGIVQILWKYRKQGNQKRHENSDGYDVPGGQSLRGGEVRPLHLRSPGTSEYAALLRTGVQKQSTPFAAEMHAAEQRGAGRYQRME